MIQNLIALAIVFSAIGLTIFSMVKSLTAKKTTGCKGCDSCGLKELPIKRQL